MNRFNKILKKSYLEHWPQCLHNLNYKLQVSYFSRNDAINSLQFELWGKSLWYPTHFKVTCQNRTHLTNERKAGVLVRNYTSRQVFIFIKLLYLAHDFSYRRFPCARLQTLTQPERGTGMQIPPVLNKGPGLFHRKLHCGEGRLWAEALICSVPL